MTFAVGNPRRSPRRARARPRPWRKGSGRRPAAASTPGTGAGRASPIWPRRRRPEGRARRRQSPAPCRRPRGPRPCRRPRHPPEVRTHHDCAHVQDGQEGVPHEGEVVQGGEGRGEVEGHHGVNAQRKKPARALLAGEEPGAALRLAQDVCRVRAEGDGGKAAAPAAGLSRARRSSSWWRGGGRRRPRWRRPNARPGRPGPPQARWSPWRGPRPRRRARDVQRHTASQAATPAQDARRRPMRAAPRALCP